MKIVNESKFDKIISSGITLVDFYADWCGPCKMLSPILEELDNEYPNITFVKVNCDNDINLASRYGIMSIPSVYVFRDGLEVSKFQGYRGKQEVKAFLDSIEK